MRAESLSSLRVCMVEACKESDAGSIGPWYVAEHARRAGYSVDILRRPKKGYDVELVSVHHCEDFERLARMPKYAQHRIVGGHVMANNPRPAVPFADAICVGEGETWIEEALPLLEQHDTVDALEELPGTIVCNRWEKGQDIPAPNAERPLPENPPYLNRPGTLSAAWYVEIARGCPYGCAFCELGHSVPFRTYPTEQIKRVLKMADTRITRKINFYAPDEVSHPDCHALFEHLRERGYSSSFSSMRIDSVLKRGLPRIPANHLIRCGIDGLTQATRDRVGKPITDDMIEEYVRKLLEAGHVTFKFFYIFGYPWETLADFDEFEALMRRITTLPLQKNVSLRIKWTPFIPQPCTPLADAGTQYDFRMVEKINVWHAMNKRPRFLPGWYIENDGMMSQRRHARQVQLTAGDEDILLSTSGAKSGR